MTSKPQAHPPLEVALTPFYKAMLKPVVVQIPKWSYLMMDGQGDPRTSMAYRDAVEALYSVAYHLKFDLRKREGLDFKVQPLEGLWWSEQMQEFTLEHRERWHWTMMIAQPAAVTAAHLEQALDEVRHKKKLPNLEQVRLAALDEGVSAQVLHLGLYASEGPTITALHAFIHEHGGRFDGRVQKHHEIYLSDPNRTTPEKLKTIIRQPFTIA